MHGVLDGFSRPILTPIDTSALTNVTDAYPMPSVGLGISDVARPLYKAYEQVDYIDPALYSSYDVKRGLRNADGSGVLVGLTKISDVHGYQKVDGKVVPDEGNLIYRGYSIAELVNGAHADNRFGYEEVAYLLLTGKLPTQTELSDFRARVDSRRQLPAGYLHIFPRTTQSHSIMNVLQRATLLLYAFDPNPDDTSPTHEIDVALSLLGRWPRTAAVAHAAAEAVAHDMRVEIPPVCIGYTMAESVLDVLRGDGGFTRDEALMLDVMLMLHAEHGGGNNSTFSTRVLSSSGTDPYSAYAAALGSLKGPKHGGANYKVSEMAHDIEAHVADWSNEDELSNYLIKILNKEVGDKRGLIYGMGHAVYTKSDPRAQLVKRYAQDLAAKKGKTEELELLMSIERLAPAIMREQRHTTKPICANIDLYTGFVYDLLGIPQDLFTPIFAMARLAGWCAHRMEELYGNARIIRPAYNSVMDERHYVSIDAR